MATDDLDPDELMEAYRELSNRRYPSGFADWLAGPLAAARAHGWALDLAPWHAEQMLVDEHITLRGISPDVDGRYLITGRRPRGAELDLEVRRVD